MYGNRRVDAVLQPVAGQGGFVVLFIFDECVKAPVFGNAHIGVSPSLVGFVAFGSAVGCYFQHEIGRLALLGYGVAIVGFFGLEIRIKGD